LRSRSERGHDHRGIVILIVILIVFELHGMPRFADARRDLLRQAGLVVTARREPGVGIGAGGGYIAYSFAGSQ
jgi:hypothetical protein